eukprot:1901044-Amphidinium_carterae.1
MDVVHTQQLRSCSWEHMCVWMDTQTDMCRAEFSRGRTDSMSTQTVKQRGAQHSEQESLQRSSILESEIKGGPKAREAEVQWRKVACPWI